LTRSLAAASEDPNIVEAYLHVHIINDEAIDFYKKQGFVVGETVVDYYKRLEPRHAVILRKRLLPRSGECSLNGTSNAHCV
jgi:N-alpha-acetyltransferase 50